MATMTKNGRVKEIHDDSEIKKYEQLGWQLQTDSESNNSQGDADDES